ncbi:alanine aminotransferase 2-like [Paramacrobiotus metropolitanus]|uniref:alanine aminotransferase 2-like n=1 Tax=Paramacrobiotus metropolitanus TaxID=2943436 RepID=UPI002446508B|nr:alanine aminotransferase 2-like [Paramacrobiotus metropolitanus]
MQANGFAKLANGHDVGCNGAGGKKLLTLDDVNPSVRAIAYAIRGPINDRANQLDSDLRNGKKLPFDKLIRCNVGDAPAMGQKPMTFYRQLLACCAYPDASTQYPADVQALSKRFLDACHGRTIGSYISNPQGLEVVRQDIAKFIQERDGGIPAYANEIFLFTGAGDGIVCILNILNTTSAGKKPIGLMVPIPTFAYYTSCIDEIGLKEIPYYLDEENSWQLNVDELNRAINNRDDCDPKILVVINPGNPTGQVLTKDNIQQIIRFAAEKNLIIMADEVYQDNIHDSSQKFHSFKKTIADMGHPYCDMELISLHSASKGLMNECGARGGYVEFHNFDQEVLDQLRKLLSIRSSPSTGQLATFAMVNLPKPGDPSYDLFIKERESTRSSLVQRARMTTELLNNIPGMHCNAVQGAMYAFPRLDLPEKFIQEAKTKGRAADLHYVMQLMDSKGVVIVPGSGFRQQPGTYHFRTTILPPVDLLHEMLEKLADFHTNLMKKYA